MTSISPDPEPCGARWPGGDRLGRHRSPCTLPAGHEGAHRAARQPVRMCVRCCAITTDPVVVSEVHQSSGPGFNVYACPECAPHFPPVPDVLDLFHDRDRRRGGGGL
ncbi:hypothetical protein OG357_13775 [Streptomyces sp. NBC_01255]|uniref:hypothetical protein n=1 Tax=Streptomyces sp. NBC_01255 TaxID=2903798 RepID=UPI002E2EB666|nr:hypothetical protein [Streptomyces sp. NBC_01255]